MIGCAHCAFSFSDYLWASMCTVLFSINDSERYPFVLAANRDEFLGRAAQPMHWWDNGVLAGKDLEAGGMWLGLKKTGEFSVVTNVRDLKSIKEEALSRGDLVQRVLKDRISASEFLSENGGLYNPYNLLYGDFRKMNFQSNYNTGSQSIANGVHGLSNASINTPWPKVFNGCRDLEAALAGVQDKQSLIIDLLDITGSTQTYPDDQLPDTGVGIEWERTLSAMNIRGEKYGTRVSTVVVLDSSGKVNVVELNRVSGEKAVFDFELIG